MTSDSVPKSYGVVPNFKGYSGPDVSQDAGLKEFVSQAAEIFGVPLAFLTFINDKEQVLPIGVGSDEKRVSLAESFCVYSHDSSEFNEIPDTLIDPRFKENPYVVAEPCLRYYGGVPIADADGALIGTLCILDTRPRKLEESQKKVLLVIARQVEARLWLLQKIDELERQKAESLVNQKAKQQSAELLKTVTNRLPVRITYIDRNFEYVFVNDTFERDLGFAPGEVIGRTIENVMGSGVFALGKKNLDRALSGETHSQELQVPYPHRTEWVLATYIPVRDSSGEVVGVVTHVMDVTEQRQAEKSLRLLAALGEEVGILQDPRSIADTYAQRLAAFLSADLAVYSRLIPGTKTAFNEGGWASDGLALRLGIIDLEPFASSILPMLSIGQIIALGDLIGDLPAGADHDLLEAFGVKSAVLVPVTRDEELVAVLGVYSTLLREWTSEDISLVRQVAERAWTSIERARVAQELQEINSLLDARVAERTAELNEAVKEAEAFNYSISHDLRAPVRALFATSRILLDEAGPSLNEEHKALLGRQVHNAGRLGTLIDELLRLSRLARAEVKRQDIDLTRLAEQIAEETESQCAIEIQPQMMVRGDAALVRTVIENLLENACKFSPNGGTVRVGKTENTLWISDEGIGFDMNYVSKIFLPFERLVTEKEFAGTGIGLANVERIIRRHGSKIWVESELGKGTTFLFNFDG